MDPVVSKENTISTSPPGRYGTDAVVALETGGLGNDVVLVTDALGSDVALATRGLGSGVVLATVNFFFFGVTDRLGILVFVIWVAYGYYYYSWVVYRVIIFFQIKMKAILKNIEWISKSAINPKNC